MNSWTVIAVQFHKVSKIISAEKVRREFFAFNPPVNLRDMKNVSSFNIV